VPRNRHKQPPVVRAEVEEPYRISAGDVLRIDVFALQEISGEYQVGPGGAITMPLLGQIVVAGLTVDEATEAVRQHLGELVRRPTLVLAVEETKSTSKSRAPSPSPSVRASATHWPRPAPPSCPTCAGCG